MFPWSIYRGDPYWVPPLIDDYRQKLELERNPFWKNACRELWIARQDGRVVGTIAAIIDYAQTQTAGALIGNFGFFECIDDPQVAGLLLGAACDWLRGQGMTIVHGPYNPSADGECGILVEGFQTRPAVMEGHTPPYYAGLIEGCGFQIYRDMVARLFVRDFSHSFEEQVPEKLRRVAERAARRPDLRLRQLNTRRWDKEIETAWRIYNTALRELPGNVPVALDDFRAQASGFRMILDPALAQIAEIDGKPVGFALAIPDANEALQRANGRLGPLGMLRMLWALRRLKRVSFKILMMLPEYQGRGIEAVLTVAVARGIWARGYQEVDMSLTGSENEKSNRYQENLGFRVYRRYRIYQKEL